MRLGRLMKSHHKQAENSCNGYGTIKGPPYYTGLSFGPKPDEYAQRTYGYIVKSAYIAPDNEETVFDVESKRIETQISAVCDRFGWRAVLILPILVRL